MSAFQINDDEYEQLYYERGEVVKVYLIFRKHMDFESGISGAKRRISRQALKEMLTPEAIAGRHKPEPPTVQQIRSALDRLVKIGMFKPVGPMVYQLPLASTDQSAQNRRNRGVTAEKPEEQPENKPQVTDLFGAGEEGATEEQPEELSRSNPPPVSDISTKVDNTFVQFWSLYPRKANKKKAQALFAKLKQPDQWSALEDVQRRVEHPYEWANKQYVPGPDVYIRNERWNDEWESLHANRTASSGSYDPEDWASRRIQELQNH